MLARDSYDSYRLGGYYPLPPIVAQRSIGSIVPITTLREHLNLFGDTSYDTILTLYSEAAQQNIEDYLGEYLGATTVEQPFSGFSQVLPLSHSRIASITSVQYWSTSGMRMTVPTTTYVFDTSTKFPRLVLASGQQWPSDISQDRDAPVSVTYSAVWTNPPVVFEQAILLTTAELFAKRENSSSVRYSEVPLSVRNLLAPHITRRF